ncbi:MAG: hypothetical protein KH385_08665 [Collinsella sp.]|uniref:hypothetical protein n=1 Tax=Paratractidigestivibacter sp. TaxID=2847316 RepID=UPI001DF23580|nr:hypothetical protein [Collinsella sp.]
MLQTVPNQKSREGIVPAVSYVDVVPQPEPQPSFADWICERPLLRYGIVALLIIAALLSEFVGRPHFENVETWSGTIEVIDAKKNNVLALTTSTIALSAAISALPDDTGTPVAEQLTQLSGNLGIVLAVLYLEKYLLTILGFLSLGVLGPVAFALLAISLLMHGRLTTSHALFTLGIRVLLVGIIAIAVVPASVWVTQRIDETYQISISQEESEGSAEESKPTDSESQENKNFWDSIASGAAQLVSNLKDGIKSVTDGVVEQVTNLIEGAIVMIVTSCLVPLLVLAVFLWMGHSLMGIDVSAPTNYLARRLPRKK